MQYFYQFKTENLKLINSYNRKSFENYRLDQLTDITPPKSMSPGGNKQFRFIFMGGLIAKKKHHF